LAVPEEINADMLAFWNGKGGDTWVARQEYTDITLMPVTDALLAFAAPRPGERVADIGCGCGAPTLEFARAVGPSGRVAGLDISGPMLAEGTWADLSGTGSTFAGRINNPARGDDHCSSQHLCPRVECRTWDQPLRAPRCSTPRRAKQGIGFVRFWPKQTWRKTQSMSLLGVKRTRRFALHMSAFDPKQTLDGIGPRSNLDDGQAYPSIEFVQRPWRVIHEHAFHPT
jgi:hypothetical protein